MKVYLAGPFFTTEQIMVISRIEKILEGHGIEHFSPRRDQQQLPEDGLNKDRMSLAECIFDRNCLELDGCDLVLACIDDFDPGTIWEMGYAYMLSVLQLGTPRIAAFSTQNHGLNLMLAECCDGILQGYDQVKRFLGGETALLTKWEGPII